MLKIPHHNNDVIKTQYKFTKEIIFKSDLNLQEPLRMCVKINSTELS